MTRKIIVCTDDTQTLSNKTISASSNTISDIDTGNLKTQATSASGKAFVVQSDGTWALASVTSQEVDNITIDMSTDNKLEVKGKALTLNQISDNALSFTIGTSAVDTKLPSELAVKTYTDAFAKTLELSMSTTDYKLTATLKDASGNTLSTQVVDLPLEEMIVNVEYDNENQRFVFTLKNGTTIVVPATGILRGVVTETATQELTNKTINASSNAITNISTDELEALTANDEEKTFVVTSDGSWSTNYVKNIWRVSALPATGNTRILYYLDTPDSTHPIGMYIWDTTQVGYIGISSSGTSNYNDLSNKPKINNVELVGNKSFDDLGIQDELDKKVDKTTGSSSFSIGADSTDVYIDM